MKNPIFLIIVIIFCIINVVDGITALFILKGEGNPLFLLTGSMMPVYILKIFVMIGVIYIYHKNRFSSPFVYYSAILILVMGSLLLSLGVISNIIGMLSPTVLNEASAMPVKAKVKGYSALIIFVYLIPFAINLLIFWLYQKSYRKAEIYKEERSMFKKKSWWRLK